jgi:lipoprotein-anchoring transpeptidase ErfK/SrfK
MRRVILSALLAALSLVFLPAAHRADANILVRVDRSTQTMEVSVDGFYRYSWAVSTGRPGLGTPAGTFHPQSMAVQWFSKRYYNSPMPHSIFFYRGFAIHGSYEISRLGGPASHGCIRLHPANAAVLFDLVRQEGMRNTTIVVQ